MPINVQPIVEPLSHKKASELAKLLNQAGILAKQVITTGTPASGNDPAIPSSEITQHFTEADLKKVHAVASTQD